MFNIFYILRNVKFNRAHLFLSQDIAAKNFSINHILKTKLSIIFHFAILNLIYINTKLNVFLYVIICINLELYVIPIIKEKQKKMLDILMMAKASILAEELSLK